MTMWVCACDSSKLKLLATIACVPTVSKPGLGCLECWTYGCAFTADWLVWGLRLSFFWLSFLSCHLENSPAIEPCTALNVFMLLYMILFRYDFALLPILFCSVVVLSHISIQSQRDCGIYIPANFRDGFLTKNTSSNLGLYWSFFSKLFSFQFSFSLLTVLFSIH